MNQTLTNDITMNKTKKNSSSPSPPASIRTKPPTSTPTSESKQPVQKSYLLPDPPIFTGRDGADEYEYEDWAIRIRDKLAIDADRFQNEQVATAYVITRVGGEAAKLILAYRLRDPAYYFKTPGMIFDVLDDVYADFERQETTALA